MTGGTRTQSGNGEDECMKESVHTFITWRHIYQNEMQHWLFILYNKMYDIAQLGAFSLQTDSYVVPNPYEMLSRIEHNIYLRYI